MHEESYPHLDRYLHCFLESSIIVIIKRGLTLTQQADAQNASVFIYMATARSKALKKTRDSYPKTLSREGQIKLREKRTAKGGYDIFGRDIRGNR
jgi:hypothetical protein